MRVLELWRYPVKSMGGQRLEAAEVVPAISVVEGPIAQLACSPPPRLPVSLESSGQVLIGEPTCGIGQRDRE